MANPNADIDIWLKLVLLFFTVSTSAQILVLCLCYKRVYDQLYAQRKYFFHIPLRKLFNKKVNSTKLRVFRCLCFPWLRPFATHKLDPRSCMCLFLGYSLNQSAFLCLDMFDNCVFVSCHVYFFEIEFLYSSFLPLSSASSPNTILTTSSWLYIPRLPLPDSPAPQVPRLMPVVTTFVSTLVEPARVPPAWTPIDFAPSCSRLLCRLYLRLCNPYSYRIVTHLPCHTYGGPWMPHITNPCLLCGYRHLLRLMLIL